MAETAYMSFDLAERLAEFDLSVSEKQLAEMLFEGVIGMDGFRYCSLEEAKDNWRRCHRDPARA
jgi:hypothetical protein